MKTYRDYINEAQQKGVAIGHFNISNIEGLWAIYSAAKNLGLPVIVGLSEGEADFVGDRQAVALVESLREEFDYPIFINADHRKSVEHFKKAVDAGYDSVIFDGAELPFSENIKATRECVEYAKSASQRTGRDILVEGELGYIGTSSAVLDKLPEGAAVGESEITTADDALRFVKETGVDLFAPAVGNIHGMLRAGANPGLHTGRIAEIKKAVALPLVLHGGSGISDEDFKAAISAGISIIHINTEIRIAWRDALKLSLQEEPDEAAPYKISRAALQAVEKVVEKRLRLFGGLD